MAVSRRANAGCAFRRIGRSHAGCPVARVRVVEHALIESFEARYFAGHSAARNVAFPALVVKNVVNSFGGPRSSSIAWRGTWNASSRICQSMQLYPECSIFLVIFLIRRLIRNFAYKNSFTYDHCLCEL